MNLLTRSRWNQLWVLTLTEFKLKDQGTFLGFLWTLLHPALTFAILYFLFTKWMGKFVDQYAAYLIVGVVQWQFFEKATTSALPVLKKSSSLIKNFKFPVHILVFSSVGAVFLCYLLEMAILLGFLMLTGIRPSANWLLLPALVVFYLVMTLGVSLSLSLLALEYQDLERIWAIVLSTGFFLTPVFYPLSVLSEGRRSLLMFNPVVHVIDVFRYSLMQSSVSSWSGVFIVGLAGTILSLLALLMFKRFGPHCIDRIISP